MGAQRFEGDMKLNRVTIKNFKAIDEATIDLSDFTVIVGANGSGKSSILQALHWMFQSGRNLAVDTNKSSTVGSTLSEKNATYMPSPEYRNSGHGPEYGNFKDTPQLDVKIDATAADETAAAAAMWIKSARNEGLSVHVPSNNSFVAALRDKSKEFSSYIPGLAGIPLSEEKRTKLIVQRQAAAGDANTVLRNVLLLLEGVTHQGKTGLKLVEEFTSQVMGNLTLQVSFDEEKNQTISATFQTEAMKIADAKRTKPLELAGIGFLQVIQIFSYLVYFRPVVLLVDEPDSHLHPTAQERLVRVLAEAAKLFETQILLTTHSPSVVRALPPDARVVWMKNGVVQPDGDVSGRQMMGWGLLDKRVLLLTEDTKIGMLRSLLSQWPDLERVVALWPLHGSGKLLDPAGCASLQTLFGDGMKIVIHRDRDFMMPAEANAYSKPYKDKRIGVWLTQSSDVESYWCETSVLESYFGVDAADATALLESSVAEAKQNDADARVRNKKRNDHRNKIPDCQNGVIGAFSDDQVVAEYSQNGPQHIVLGKTLCEKVRGRAQEQNLAHYQSFGKKVPPNLNLAMAQDLREIIDALLI
jgi:ABC-type cobalamin/Fe3+-siderophores transport system ATPase subunit